MICRRTNSRKYSRYWRMKVAMGPNYIVPARSWSDIEKLTDQLRGSLGLSHNPRFPVMQVMEHVLDHQLALFRLLVGTSEEMDDAEGLTDPSGSFVMLRDDVYEKAWANDGRARFTASHELGHWVLHTNVPMARAAPDHNVPPYKLSEQQANRFAVELLMPSAFISRLDTAKDLVDRFGVSREAASLRLKNLRGKI